MLLKTARLFLLLSFVSFVVTSCKDNDRGSEMNTAVDANVSADAAQQDSSSNGNDSAIPTDSSTQDTSVATDATIADGAPPCDTTSCPAEQVCSDSDVCVSDECVNDSNCPTVYSCRQNICVLPCFSSSDCRETLGYSCRLLDLNDNNTFCGPSGSGITGDSCSDMSDCGLDMACLDGDSFPGGYCAHIGCLENEDCDFDSMCVDFNGVNVCLFFCFENSDCRQTEGYSCNEDVCIH